MPITSSKKIQGLAVPIAAQTMRQEIIAETDQQQEETCNAVCSNAARLKIRCRKREQAEQGDIANPHDQ